MSEQKEMPLQMNLFEPGMTDTVAVTELYGAEPGGIFDFLGLDWKDHTIKTCWGDLRVMCDALEDYANVLERVIKEWGLQGWREAAYEIHAARCREIARKYANAIGYDREAALKKCQKRREKADDDVGEEAMSLLVKYGSRKAKKQKDEKAADVPTDANSQADGYINQIGLFQGESQ